MDCETMFAVATYKPLITCLIVLLAIGVIALPCLILVIFKIWTNSLYHLNTRVILLAHCVGLIVHLFHRIFYHGWELYNYLIVLPGVSSACDIISSSDRCFYLRSGFNFGMWFAICTTPMIVYERWLALKKIGNYQKDKQSWIYIIIFQFLLTFFLLSLVYARTSFGKKTYYCLATSTETPYETVIAFVLLMTIQLVSVLVFRSLFKNYANLRELYHTNGSTLTKRYQVEESLRSLNLISTPVYLMFLCQFTYGVCSFIGVMLNEHFSRETFYLTMEIAIFAPEYAVFFSIVMITKEKSINLQNVKSLRNTIRVTPQEYFDNYKKSWNF